MEGEWMEGEEQVAAAAQECFKKQFTDNYFMEETPILRYVQKIWKRRNANKFGGDMSYMSRRGGIFSNLILLAKQRYLWIQNMPNNWPEIVRFLIEYSPKVGCKMLYWKLPKEHYFKCNTYGDSKGNPRPSSSSFCVRDDQGNLDSQSISFGSGNRFIGCKKDGRRRLAHFLGGTNFLRYNNFQALPKEAKALLNMDKRQIPNLRITMLQNGNFTHNG
ncbi:hypothetical protein H5410_021763 [Solanum commersonii]|uniref:Uncharacterized protein n=1 Tax=Solanum commersonii TaxID=4109 RepID=A0A9J5ZCV5_SOLCO|nr:hypothetical protein H5410_021763 [Solanum commersonii]